ncbi:MAG TPA: glycosyltransferase family A protein [Anaerolineales bacterium]|nr:glycosyltransferase family A protein [Anaerolineales bacterium]
MPPCSIIIRAYNESAHLGRLLEGIAQQTVRDAEVILVDSGSTDGTQAIARAHGAEIVTIAPEEFTFGRSLNRGLAAASAELAVIASAHVYPVYPDWLERLLEPFRDPGIALTYGKQRGGEATRFSEQQVFARWFPETSNPAQAHPFCNNANAAIRRDLWEQHPYDETLTGLEDLAWAKWALGQGRLIAYSAEAEVVHIHDETPRQVYNRYRREGMAFKRLFDEAHFNLYDCLRMTAANAVSDLSRARGAGVAGRAWREILWFRTAQFWGTYQGYREAHNPLTAPLRQTFYYPSGGEDEPSPAREVDPIRYTK